MAFCENPPQPLPLASVADLIPPRARLQDDNFAAGWNDLITVIRDNNTIPGTMRELMVRAQHSPSRPRA